jgi:hypothetical protein
MSNTTRIPQTISGFNSYINSTTAYLLNAPMPADPNNGTRLGLTPVEMAEWSGRQMLWSTDLFPKYSNENTLTSVVKTNVKNFMKAFRLFANPLLDRMAASAQVTPADAAALKFVITPNEPTPRGEIEDVPYLKIQALGGGKLKFRARITADSTRSSRHPLADALEMKYSVLPANYGGGGATPTPGSGTPATPPLTADQCTNSIISTKAIYNVDLGQNNKNKMFYCFIRWVNLVNSANSGPWSEQFESGIL